MEIPSIMVSFGDVTREREITQQGPVISKGTAWMRSDFFDEVWVLDDVLNGLSESIAGRLKVAGRCQE